ncbi:MAG TPA: SDR family NAD(P)-dependent oxidoreductase, partial [Bacteroidales bacterium]
MKNKIVLITGATSGIGEACAEKFAEQGASLILNSRNAAKISALGKRLYEKYKINILELP